MSIPRILFAAAFLLAIAVPASAHRPIIEIAETSPAEIADPVRASQAVYGRLVEPGEVDVYVFTPESDGEIPVEVLVPVRPSNAAFRPSFSFGEDAAPQPIENVPAPEGPRTAIFEPYSVERLYAQSERTFQVRAGVTYRVVVFEPLGHVGDYALAIGTAEDFSDADYGALIADVARIKLGLVGGREAPWLDLLGLFLFMAGFVIGLGAVSVIDIHGFLARRSAYWTEATIRAHKVTKPMIWIGLALALAGAAITYRDSGLSGVGVFQAALASLLVLNGLYLTFRVSPILLKRERDGEAAALLPAVLQAKIAASFVVSFIGWWTSLFLLAWHLLVLR